MIQYYLTLDLSQTPKKYHEISQSDMIAYILFKRLITKKDIIFLSYQWSWLRIKAENEGGGMAENLWAGMYRKELSFNKLIFLSELLGPKNFLHFSLPFPFYSLIIYTSFFLWNKCSIMKWYCDLNFGKISKFVNLGFPFC